MADLGKSNAQWLRIFRELAMFFGPQRALTEMADMFGRSRTQFTLDAAPLWATALDTAVGFALSGVVLGTHTDEEGRMWVRVTGTGPYTVTIYSASGGSAGDAICAGSASAGAEITLTASNSSGVTGTWELPGSVTANTADTLQILTFQDWPARLRGVFDETIADDAHTRAVIKEGYDQVRRDLIAARDTFLGYMQRALLSDGDVNEIARGNAFASSADTALVAATATDAGDGGGVTVSRTGFFETFRLGMVDETTGSTQTVLQRGPTAATTTFGSGNAGTYSVPTHTPLDRCPALTATFKCERGVDTGDLGNEAFRATLQVTEGGLERRITSPNLLVIGQPWSDVIGLGPITVSRTLSKTGDGSNNYFTAASGATVSGENNTNTDSGVLYWKQEAGTSNWDISFYSSSSRDESTLVAKASNIASGAAFTATQKNGSSLSVVWQLGGTEGAATGTLDLQPPKVDADGSGTPDTFEVAVSVPATAGVLQTLASRAFGRVGAQFNEAASSETITDNFVKAGTFHPRAVLDN